MPEEGKPDPCHPYKGWVMRGLFFLARNLTLTLLSGSQILVQGVGEDTVKLGDLHYWREVRTCGPPG